MQFENVIFFTDSMIVLAWICSQARGFKPFVSVRVGEIQNNSDPSQWRHVPGEMNVADDVSRGILVQDLSERWKNGPEFLRLLEEKWPQKPVSTTEDQLEGSSEHRKGKIVCAVTTPKPEEAIDCKRFSSWRHLIRVTAHIRRLGRKVREKQQDNREESRITTTQGPLSPEELLEAEVFRIKAAQESLHDRLSRGDFKTLSPFLDEGGILRVGGRVDEAVVSYESKHPAMLPYEHWISLLITRQMHQYGHTGVATTAAKTKKKYRILKVNDLAKSVKFRCVFCREMAHKAESQLMADLPKLRLAPYTPPFYYTACDYFGPYKVKFGCTKTTKYYGVLFTCLNTRAVHLELAVDYSTMEFLQVLRRFFSIRGQPAVMISDNGSQLVGAKRELREMVAGWDNNQLREFCAERGMK